MIDPTQLTFKKLDFEGVQTLVDWAAKEGWNPGPSDAAVFWKTDPDGFYGLFNGDKLVAGGAIISYGGAFGFMGLYIVHPDYRGNGIGRRLWYLRRDTLLSRLRNDASVGMDGVVEMQPFYKKGGFEIAFRDERYQRMGEDFNYSPSVVKLKPSDIPQVQAYDQICFGFSRPSFLDAWLSMKDSHVFLYKKNGQMMGYAVLRKTGVGAKIGPLFADDMHVAEELYKACLTAGEGAPVFLDIPVINEEAVALVKKYNADYVFECARMYRGTPPDLPIHQIFGITTFELG